MYTTTLLDDYTSTVMDHECDKNKTFRLEEAWMTTMEPPWPKDLNGILHAKWNKNYTLFHHLDLNGLE